jgi:hypothetical protein
MLAYVSSLIGSFGQKRLPVYEMPISTVQQRLPRGQSWGATTTPKSDLTFSGMGLAHAVIKADFLEYRNPILPGIGFVIQSHHIIDWPSHNFCLRSGGTNLLSDFVRTSMAGRIGQGLALLLAHSEGYTFTANLREYLRSIGVPTTGPSGQPLPIADFICDSHGNRRAIVESKASFSLQRNDRSKIKHDLKNGLENQVLPWMGKFNPSAMKSFVIGSYLRESNNPNYDPSMMVFVDPEVDGQGGHFEMPLAAVRRENFAAWLAAMGLFRQAERLRSYEANKFEEITFARFEIGQKMIAFPAPFGSPSVLSRGGVDLWVGAGIEYEALSAVSNSAKGNDKPLLSYEVLEAKGDQVDTDAYSIFPDGTFFGSFSLSQFRDLVGVTL